MAISYLSLVRLSPAQTSEARNRLMEMMRSPPSGITIEGAWTTFGAIDLAIVFSAEDPQAATNFVVEKLRGLPGVTSTETLQCLKLQA